ncbi:Hypothetical protein PHPALM_4381 [Phytophthora palmivora]|uniref:Uncharacterized protein n=1 Tax=Phytophthora palmivora TaxID=4796 RepID=A0A2P4YK61_9STRA|nr:Hypothetical protein PHPALM_4381 [Phytophthora palmivora]
MTPSNTTVTAATSTTVISTTNAPAHTSKWTVNVSFDIHKPAHVDNYKNWSLDQLKLECTARSLNVTKNTRKDKRVKILNAWDVNKDSLEALLSRQRKKAYSGRGEADKRTKGRMFRLLNVLFSLKFYEAFLTIGNQLRREEIDQGGSTFWMDVAAVFSSDTDEFDRIISDDAVFEDIDASYKMVHSASKLKRKWKEAEILPVLKLDLRSPVKFCAANIYPEDEDDSTMEGKETPQQSNRKRRRNSQSDSIASILERVNDLIDKETSESLKAQEGTWNEQKLIIQEQRASQYLSTLYTMLDRNGISIHQLLEQRKEYISKGLDAANIGEMLEARLARRTMIEAQISEA